MVRLAVSTEYQRVTNGRTSCHGIVRAMDMHNAVKMIATTRMCTKKWQLEVLVIKSVNAAQCYYLSP